VATAFNLPVMIHMGQTVSPLPRLLPLLKRGDIVTHMFAPPPNSIVDDSGHILTEVHRGKSMRIFRVTADFETRQQQLEPYQKW
jgi:predicted amidohydrolase